MDDTKDYELTGGKTLFKDEFEWSTLKERLDVAREEIQSVASHEKGGRLVLDVQARRWLEWAGELIWMVNALQKHIDHEESLLWLHKDAFKRQQKSLDREVAKRKKIMAVVGRYLHDELHAEDAMEQIKAVFTGEDG